MSDNFERDELGRFKPGHGGGPGRPSKAKEEAILDSIRSTFEPEEIAAHLREALDIAIEQRSPRGIVSVLSFVASYSLGKPTVRDEQSNDRLEALKDVLAAIIAQNKTED